MAAEETECCLHDQLVLNFVTASKDFVVLSHCVRVCRGWRDFVCKTLRLGPENTLQMTYFAIANAFTTALPGTMCTMWRNRVFQGGLTQLQACIMIWGAVEHVVDSLKAHLHSRLAVLMCITKLQNISTMLGVLRIHTGTAARHSTWTLLRVLCAHPVDAVLGFKVMRLILRYIEGMRDMRPVVCLMDQRDTVVLSAAQLPRAVAVIDAYLATWPFTAAIQYELVVTMLRRDCAEVREWIVRGSLLNIEAHAQ